MNDKPPVIWESQRNAARITGVPVRTIENWIESKRISASKINYVNLVEVFQVELDRRRKEIDRLKDSPSNPDNPQQRLTIAQCRKVEAEASLKELELEQARGKLIDFEEALSDLDTAFLSARSKLLGIPSRLSLQLSGIGDPKAIAALLTEVIDEALESLSNDFANSDKPNSINDESKTDQSDIAN